MEHVIHLNHLTLITNSTSFSIFVQTNMGLLNVVTPGGALLMWWNILGRQTFVAVSWLVMKWIIG